MEGLYNTRVSRDVWNVFADTAENEADDNITMVHEGYGVIAYANLYRWFTDVSGLGVSEQAIPTHPRKRRSWQNMWRCGRTK